MRARTADPAGGNGDVAKAVAMDAGSGRVHAQPLEKGIEIRNLVAIPPLWKLSQHLVTLSHLLLDCPGIDIVRYGDWSLAEGFLQGKDALDIMGIAGDPDPAVTVSQANGDAIVHIAWDASHQANILLSGVQLTSFVAEQDYHLI